LQEELKETSGVAKMFTEGEAEKDIRNFGSKAMAKWADPARRFLMCPRCGISEDTEIH
jgi:hypothetical protein